MVMMDEDEVIVTAEHRPSVAFFLLTSCLDIGPVIDLLAHYIDSLSVRVVPTSM